ncbi:hypothetical protein EVAR_59305_1 [Eumeta japonica]|uniref:Uncharacterized protein n=1 Tax=Eumeta variegata TaxID=151549 RepID=A0A4C1Y8B0_EUMVA|nr:hypothetical protein EVAR_59305_1 [Eumeta japonica]
MKANGSRREKREEKISRKNQVRPRSGAERKTVGVAVRVRVRARRVRAVDGRRWSRVRAPWPVAPRHRAIPRSARRPGLSSLASAALPTTATPRALSPRASRTALAQPPVLAAARLAHPHPPLQAGPDVHAAQGEYSTHTPPPHFTPLTLCKLLAAAGAHRKLTWRQVHFVTRDAPMSTRRGRPPTTTTTTRRARRRRAARLTVASPND